MDKKFVAHLGDDEGHTDEGVKLREVRGGDKTLTEDRGVLRDGDLRERENER